MTYEEVIEWRNKYGDTPSAFLNLATSSNKDPGPMHVMTFLFEEVERLRSKPIEFYTVSFDCDTFGHYRTEEEARRARDNKDNGAWEDCKIKKVVIK